MLLSLCLFKHCSEYLKYPPSQMKCLFLSLQQRLRLFGALRSKMTVFFFVVVFFFSKMAAAAARGRTELLGLFCGADSDRRSHCPVFSPFRSLLPPHHHHHHPLSAECQVSLGLKCFFFPPLYCLILMSMLFQSCVSGSHCLCLTGRRNVLAFFFFF